MAEEMECKRDGYSFMSTSDTKALLLPIESAPRIKVQKTDTGGDTISLSLGTQNRDWAGWAGLGAIVQ